MQPAENSSDSYVPADFVFGLLASSGLSYAVAFNWGERGQRAFQPLVLGGLLIVWRFITLLRRRAASSFKPDLVWLPLVFLLLTMAWAGYEDAAIKYNIRPWIVGRNAELAFGCVLFSYIPSILGAREPGWLGHARFIGLAILIAVIGIDVIQASPKPLIDVWDLQQRAADLLIRGQNPYSELRVRDTGWGITLPFVYPPTVIYLGAIARALFGDTRYANLALMIVTGISLRSVARRGGLKLPSLAMDAPALIFWLQAKFLFVLEQAWVDVIPLGALTAGIAVFLGRFRLVGVILMGIALSSKQTMFWFLPLIFLFLNFRRREWIVLFATMAALVLPFVVWDFNALTAGTLGVHGSLSPRPDALAFMAWYHAKYRIWRSTAIIAWGASLAVLALAGWRLRGSRSAFGLASASIYFLFFFFQKWAFANYYFFVVGLAALAAALALHGSPVREVGSTGSIGTADGTTGPAPPPPSA